MIITFQSITESGSSDPKLMAAGISQAMIATRARPGHRDAAAVRQRLARVDLEVDRARSSTSRALACSPSAWRRQRRQA